jgi:FixJ family two-component response regulator
MSKRAVTIELTAAERSALEDSAKRRRTAQGLARRARIVLAAADGQDNKAVAQEIGADEKTAGKWRRRFAVHRAPRSARTTHP